MLQLMLQLLQLSWLLTQQMSWLLTQQMSSLQPRLPTADDGRRPGPLGSCGLLVLDCPVPDLNYVGLRPPCVILGWAPEGAQPKITLNVGLRPPFAPAARFPAPLSLLLVQARRARPVRGEDSQASQGQPSKPSQRWMVHITLGSQPRWPPAFFSQKNSNPQNLDMPAWSNFVNSGSNFDQKWSNMFRARIFRGNFG